MDAKKKQRLNRATSSGAERHNYTRQKTKNLEETNLPTRLRLIPCRRDGGHQRNTQPSRSKEPCQPERELVSRTACWVAQKPTRSTWRLKLMYITWPDGMLVGPS